ncbi:transposable element Tcb2 transposase [Trichonephila clavipes]|uniref:Transposable element Tcb2 transposase n=1 Tax=Trichonephila clavipes TaxID=2585209 RepID=A0A8X6SWE2_TRICX|nr:transposable element Tcb2 transposase [Trichonephila clavipes]
MGIDIEVFVWNVIVSCGVNGSETPTYERYSSPTTPSLGYWHHGSNSDCIKPAPWCRSACSPTAGMCYTNIKASSRLQGVSNRACVNWRRNELSNVLFSDETHFSVHPDNRRIFIWRDRSSRNNPAFVHESVRFGVGGVLVYGGISIDGSTYLYIIRDGPLTARRYRDEILRPIVVPYAAAIGDDFILLDNNSRPHRANLIEDFLFEEGIIRMEWSACPPDMNPIEHVWDALGRRVAVRQPSPQTLQELERAILEEWDRITQLVINSLIDSMPQMCSTLLAVRGNHTPY